MRPSYRPELPPPPPLYRTQILDHLGLVAGMFDELGIGDVIDQATHQNPEMRDLTVGEAVKAMVLNGLGFINQALYLVPRFFQHKPTSRLISLRVTPAQLNDDALGRALDILYAAGVTELYSLIAATAAQRLGLAPRFAHLDSTSFHVDGHYNSAEEPDERVIHITRGYSRDQRPDLNQVMLDLIVEHQAAIPVLMKPLSGNSSDATDFGQIIADHMAQLQITYGLTYLVADSALYSAENLQKLAETRTKWLTRVPATLREAQAVLAQADPQTMAPLTEEYRYQVVPATYGGVEQRWMLIHSAPRQPQAQRTVDKQLRQHSEQEVKAWKKLCGTPFACEADARQALSVFEQGLQATFLHSSTVHATPRYGTRGRPRHSAPPAQVVYHIAGALTSSLTVRQARIDQHSCFILATNELDDTQLSPQELLASYKGQSRAERGFRFLKDPQFFASSFYLKKPERIMALLMVMTVCLLVYAALQYRIRQALKAHQATFPDQKGKRVQNPTARWVFHYFVGIHLLSVSGQWPLVLNLTEEHCNLLKLLGRPYMQLYGVKYS
jgi:transposase